MKNALNQSGQMTIEMTLMVVLSVGVAIFVGQQFRSNELFANLVSSPWAQVQGLIQNGVWGTPEDTMNRHPSQFRRITTVVDANEAARRGGP